MVPYPGPTPLRNLGLGGPCGPHGQRFGGRHYGNANVDTSHMTEIGEISREVDLILSPAASQP